MRNGFVYLLIGIVCFAISLFLIGELSPFKTEKIEELIVEKKIPEDGNDILDIEIQNLISSGLIFTYFSDNVFLIVGVLSIGLLLFLTGVQIIFEKLFLRKFFEKPSNLKAFRRSFLIVVPLIFFLYARLNNIEVYIQILIIVIPILIELILNIGVGKKSEEVIE